jgi:hypothetical protein
LRAKFKCHGRPSPRPTKVPQNSNCKYFLYEYLAFSQKELKPEVSKFCAPNSNVMVGHLGRPKSHKIRIVSTFYFDTVRFHEKNWNRKPVNFARQIQISLIRITSIRYLDRPKSHNIRIVCTFFAKKTITGNLQSFQLDF